MRTVLMGLLKELGSSVWSDLTVIEALFVAQIVAASQQAKDAESFIETNIQRYDLSGLPFSLSDDKIKNLLLRISSYIEKMTPLELCQIIFPFSPAEKKIGKMKKSDFYHISRQVVNASLQSKGNPDISVCQTIKDAINTLPGANTYTDDFVTALASIENVTINPNILSGRNTYVDAMYEHCSSMNISPYQAMELYGQFLENKEKYISSPIPWQSACQRNPYLEIKYPDDGMDTLFFDIVRTSETDPIDVVKAFLYFSDTDDSGFQTSYMLHLICSLVHANDRLLVIDPSIDLLQALNCKHLDCDCLLSKNSLVSVYSQIFPDIAFSERDDGLDQDSEYDVIIDVSRNLSEDAFDHLKHCRENTIVLVEMPNYPFEKNKREILDIYQENRLLLSHVLLLPGFTPKQKKPKGTESLFIFTISTGNPNVHDVDLFTMKYSSDTTVRILHEHPYVAYPDFYDSTMTIHAIAEAALNTLRGKPKGNQRFQPHNLMITPDIAIQISIYPKKTIKYGYTQGSVNYRKINGKKLRKQSWRLTAIDKTTLIQNMENLAYQELLPDITEDIYCAIRNGKITDPSLKTIWFIMQGQLKAKRKSRYNESLCKEIFATEHPLISSISAFRATKQDYINAILSDYQIDDYSNIPIKMLNQIDLILSMALSRQLSVQRDPIQRMIEQVSNRMTESQMEVRDALAKRAYSTKEERKLIQFIFTETDDLEELTFIIYSILRVYLPLTRNEIRCLTWNDFNKKTSRHNIDTFSISKKIDEDNVIHPYFTLPKLRDIGAPPCFSRIFKLYKKKVLSLSDNLCLPDKPFLVPTGTCSIPPNEQLKEYDQRIDSITGINEEHFYVLLPDAYKARVTDLYDYFGDIHYTHWQYIAKEAGLEDDEICYVLGIMPDNTFAAHYADYHCPLSLMKIANKLNRWISSYLDSSGTTHISDSNSIPIEIKTEPSPRKAVFHGEIHNPDEEITLTVDCQFGSIITITTY